MAEHNYEIYGPDGQPKLSAPESCRYPRRIELQMLECGYTIRLDGKRLTKAEIRRELRHTNI